MLHETLWLVALLVLSSDERSLNLQKEIHNRTVKRTVLRDEGHDKDHSAADYIGDYPEDYDNYHDEDYQVTTPSEDEEDETTIPVKTRSSSRPPAHGGHATKKIPVRDTDQHYKNGTLYDDYICRPYVSNGGWIQDVGAWSCLPAVAVVIVGVVDHLVVGRAY